MTLYRFAWTPDDERFQYGAGRLQLVLADEVQPDDPVVVTGGMVSTSLVRQLLEQAHRLDPPPIWMHTSSAQITVDDDAWRRNQAVQQAAQAVVVQWREHTEAEDVPMEVGMLLDNLADALSWDAPGEDGRG